MNMLKRNFSFFFLPNRNHSRLSVVDLPKGKFPNDNQHSQEQVRNQHLTKPDLQKLVHSIELQLSLLLSC